MCSACMGTHVVVAAQLKLDLALQLDGGAGVQDYVNLLNQPQLILCHVMWETGHTGISARSLP